MKPKILLNLWGLSLILLFPTQSLTAQSKGDAANINDISMLPIYQCRQIQTDLVLTGKVDDPQWQSAEVIHLSDPVTGRPGRYKTTVRILYNSRNLYIAFECEDEYIWGTLTEPDSPVFTQECVEAFICPSGKIRQYYEIDVSPLNTVFDAFLLNGRQYNGPFAKIRSWIEYTCSNLITMTHVNGNLGEHGARGWSLEYAIPFSSIIGSDNLIPNPGDEWRVNFYRIDGPEPKHPEYYAWSPTGANDFHRTWRFGILKFTSGKME